MQYIRAIYEDVDGSINIGAGSTEDELSRAEVLARRFARSADMTEVGIGLKMLGAISDARSDAAELAGERVVFKSVRAV